MAQTTMNIRIDEDVKREFDDFCSKVGINPSVAVNMFARAVLRERRIPFEITDDALLDANNRKAFGNAFRVVQATPRTNGAGDLTMDDINAEIASYRRGN